MSAMLKPTPPPPPPLDSPEGRSTVDLIRRRLAEHERIAQALRNTLEELSGAPTEGQNTVLTMRRSGPYSGLDLVDVAKRHLGELGHAVAKDDLARTLVDMGIWPHQSAEKAMTSVKSALTILVKDPEERKKRQPTKNFQRVIRERNGLIGLAEWPDEKFAAKSMDGKQ